MSQKTDDTLNRYFAYRLAAILPPEGQYPAEGQKSVRELAKEVGVSGATISDVRNGKRGVGIKVLRKFATYFGMTLDETEKAAAEWLASQPQPDPATEPKVELDERYHNRAVAAQIARDNNVSEEAIEHVRSKVFDRNDDPPIGWWYDRMKAADAEFKALRLDPGKTDRDAQRRRDVLAQIKREQGDED